MFDALSFGRKIHERRKAQNITQEQLGSELGISGQSVSKWENGESIPDLTLLPALCKILRISSDVILDIDCGIGVENLCMELAKKISGMEPSKRNDALLNSLKFLLLLGRSEQNSDWIPENHMDFEWLGMQINRVAIWRSKGMACFVMNSVLGEDAPSPQILDSMKVLLSDGCWEIAM